MRSLAKVSWEIKAETLLQQLQSFKMSEVLSPSFLKSTIVSVKISENPENEKKKIISYVSFSILSSYHANIELGKACRLRPLQEGPMEKRKPKGVRFTEVAQRLDSQAPRTLYSPV